MPVKTVIACLLLLICSGISVAQAPTSQTLYAEWLQQRITHTDPSRVRHVDLKKYLDRLRAEGVTVHEVGRSVADREIYQMEFGTGPLKVFMWSQMHGDEPTATSALIDLFHYLQQNRRTSTVSSIERSITLRAVPMLNPDGAELFQRRNLQFIDINRDARALVTPEGQLLKKLRDEWSPDIGFNLHNQNPRTAVGGTGRQAAISLLAVPFDESGSDSPGRIRSKKICARIVEALAPFISGHIGRYDDTFNPRAFGDLITRWGTPVVLIETGALRGRSEMDLVQLNFVALTSVLKGLADGSVERADPRVYDGLRFNESGTIFSLIIRNALVINRLETGQARVSPFTSDIAINEDAAWSESKSQRRASVQDVGDLSVFYGLEEADARGYYVTCRQGVLRPGTEAALLFYKKERAVKIDWGAADLEARFPPDAVYRNGEWSGRENLKSSTVMGKE
ncbi:MAG: peptidase M14 [Pyrinomonadaceae bacterium]|nr:peptidase M14 [Pyrinomonadaceae bacterium]